MTVSFHILPHCTQKCLLMIFNSFAKSRIGYGLLIYGFAAKKLRKMKNATLNFVSYCFSRRNLIPYTKKVLKHHVENLFEFGTPVQYRLPANRLFSCPVGFLCFNMYVFRYLCNDSNQRNISFLLFFCFFYCL